MEFPGTKFPRLEKTPVNLPSWNFRGQIFQEFPSSGRNEARSSRYRAQKDNRIRHHVLSTQNEICIKTKLKWECWKEQV
jgi:hypothetical protein